MPSPIVTVDPTTMYDDGSIAVAQQVAEYLIWVNNDLSLRPVLAKSWSPNADATVWTFNLQPGVTFQDGKPFGTDDVVFTMGILLNPKTVSAALASFQGILSQGGVQKVDDSTVAFHLDQPFADFPYFVASTNYDCLILPTTYKTGTWQSNPVGTGPFKMTKFTPKQGATFVKNPNYWQKGKPYLDGVSVQFIDDTQAEALALQSGSIDVMLTTPVQGSQALFTDTNLKVLTTPSTQSRFLHMRVDTAPFTNKAVRQALAYTIDRPALVTNLFDGKAQIGNDNVFCPLYPLAPKNIPQRAQDIAKAKSLLGISRLPQRPHHEPHGRGVRGGAAVRHAAAGHGQAGRHQPEAEPGDGHLLLRLGQSAALARGAHGHHRLDLPRRALAVLPAGLHLERRVELVALQGPRVRRGRQGVRQHARRGQAAPVRVYGRLDPDRRDAVDHLVLDQRQPGDEEERERPRPPTRPSSST